MLNLHSFHIPVMGLGYTLDSPVKVAHLGISSAVALAEDTLIEKMREFYSRQFNLPFVAIRSGEFDARCERIKAYLNLLDQIVRHKFEELKRSMWEKGSEMERLIDLLPEMSEVKKRFHQFLNQGGDIKTVVRWLRENIAPGSIDVNIMTKLDKENFHEGNKLPIEYNDAHAALRGFAESNLHSSVVLSAGMNPYLYSYIEKFPVFFPDENGELKKKITLKVSDYRSAMIQGRFLAKKGLWVSEFRVESGLNCGGHAFATDGFLLGPVLEEFKENREALYHMLFDIYSKALKEKNISVPENRMPMRVTAQGGVGTSEEHKLLLEYYGVDSVGWGTPFLLVPEATSVDQGTLELLAKAGVDDLYLSNVSPLGVPFNNIRNNTKDLEKMERVRADKPGSPCTRQHLKLFRDEEGNSICTASREYQKKQLEQAEATITAPEELKRVKQSIYDKVCLCIGLGTSTLMSHGISVKSEGTGVSICPGPNIAWFDRTFSLKEMTGHIYGRNNIITRTDRPHMFINELKMYVEYLGNKVSETLPQANPKAIQQLRSFKNNLLSGIDYYKSLIDKVKEHFCHKREQMIGELDRFASRIEQLPIA